MGSKAPGFLFSHDSDGSPSLSWLHLNFAWRGRNTCELHKGIAFHKEETQLQAVFKRDGAQMNSCGKLSTESKHAIKALQSLFPEIQTSGKPRHNLVRRWKSGEWMTLRWNWVTPFQHEISPLAREEPPLARQLRPAVTPRHCLSVCSGRAVQQGVVVGVGAGATVGEGWSWGGEQKNRCIFPEYLSQDWLLFSGCIWLRAVARSLKLKHSQLL